jgi:peptide/nickel transport system substrate-binding protein
MRGTVHRIRQIAVVLFAVLSMVLAGCGAAAPAADPVRLVFAGNQEPAGIDVVTMSGNVNEREVAAQIFETLVYLDNDQVMHPGLATAWERSADATEWTFTIRQGVKWHDGRAFAAQDVVDYFNYVRDESATGSGPGTVKPALKSAELVGTDQVKVTLTAPRPDFLVELADPGLGIGNIQQTKAAGADGSFNPIGTGPFKFKEWVRGSEIILVKNPDWTWASPMYKLEGGVKIDELVFRFIPEAQTRIASLEAGEIDFVDLLPFPEVQRVKADERFKVTGFLLPGMPQMNYMNTALAPTDDLSVRQAIIYATDKAGIIESVYFGMVEPAYGPLSRAFPEYDAGIESLYSYDPEKAKQLLDAAGWVPGADGVRVKDGQRLAVSIVENKSWNDWVYVLQSNLQAVGFEATVLTTQGPSNTEAIVSGQHQVPAMGDVFAVATAMTRDWHSEGYGTFPSGHFLTGELGAQLDSMLKAAETELDPAARKQKYSEIQFFIMENALMVPIFELYFYAAHPANLTGFVTDGTGFYKYFASASFTE